MATGLSQPSPLAPAALFGSMVAIGLAVAFAHQGGAQHRPAPVRGPAGPTSISPSRVPTERIRGRNRRR